MDGSPPGSISARHISGWIQTDILSKWFDHFVKFTKPTESDSVNLVLYGHNSQTRNIEVIEKARLNIMAVICLLPHSTDKMQTLDVEFMKSLNTYYTHEVSKWLHHKQGRVVTHFHIANLYKDTTAQNSINCFRKTGAIPCNRDVFSDEDFAIHIPYMYTR
ncbi:hypothetical protein PR048_026965 [Dryococelus australis]|uniref:DDE-1 domain-containing protein n=1 Tax=Dryococelus australis TaxID=614101 RepID=A0ABQ9GMS5_9NEOP|nr:hypothetical protein PR048_026965 [Dryococelus australis]